MAEKIQTGEQLQKSVQETLDLVRKASGTALKKAVDKTSRETVKETKKNSPKRTGVYAKSWGSRKIKNSGTYGREVYQKKKPALTHLLQNGHEIGGAARFRKNKSRTDAFPHIPPEEEVEEKFEENLVAEIDKEMGK